MPPAITPYGYHPNGARNPFEANDAERRASLYSTYGGNPPAGLLNAPPDSYGYTTDASGHTNYLYYANSPNYVAPGSGPARAQAGYQSLIAQGVDPAYAAVVSGYSPGPTGSVSVPPSGGTYTSNLGGAQAEYDKIIASYGDAAKNLNTNQQQILAGYGALFPAIDKTIEGVDASQRQSIKDAYVQQSGAADQNLVTRGLGNSTVRNSVQRGLTLDKQKADIALSNQMAQLRAGYQSQAELARLGYLNSAQQQNLGLLGQQLGFQGNYLNAQNQLGLGYSQLQNQRDIAQLNASTNLQQALISASRSGGGGGGGRPILVNNPPVVTNPSAALSYQNIYGPGGANERHALRNYQNYYDEGY